MAKSTINAEQLELILTNVMSKCIPEIIAKVLDSFETMIKNMLTAFEARFDNLTSVVSQANERITDLELKITEIHTSTKAQPTFSSVVGSTPVPAAKADPSVQLLLALETEKFEREKRRRNVIVSGLPPVSGVSDSAVFSKFCEDNLTVKPLLQNCRRVGRSTTGKPRLLKVTLDNEHSVEDLIESSFTLRHSDDPAAKNVYINRDLTPMEVEAAYESRQKRKAATGTSGPSTSS